MSRPKRRRGVPLYVWVSEAEHEIIRRRMEEAGTQNMLTIQQDEHQVWTLQNDTSGTELHKKIAPPVIAVVCDFVLRYGDWTGTATDLAHLLEPQLEKPIAPNALMSKINQHHKALEELGVLYSVERTAQRKTISLRVTAIQTDEASGENATTCRGQAS